MAGEYGFWHLQLAIAGFSGVKMAHHVATALWIGLLFPDNCLYATKAASKATELFPLLMLRPHRRFFLQDQVHVPLAWPRNEPDLLRKRVLAFLQELHEAIRLPKLLSRAILDLV